MSKIIKMKFDNLKFSGKSHMHQGVNADAVYDRLAELSAFGKQLLVTEFDVQGISQNIIAYIINLNTTRNSYTISSEKLRINYDN